MLTIQPLTKKARRDIRKQKLSISTGMHMENIKPLTENQGKAFTAWYNDKDLFLHGCAGTGKTLIAFYLALREVLLDNADKVIVVRSVVPSREMGFLPGSANEKTKIFELPYYEICRTLFGRHDAYEILKQRGTIEFITTSHIRGMTFDNCVVIVDEIQNTCWAEQHTVMGRIGTNTRVIIAGDIAQSDLETHRGKHDVEKLMTVTHKMQCFEYIEMRPEDVVRSGKVKQYILACNSLGYN
jgi:phosphate starvation-inducible protein PhoH